MSFLISLVNQMQRCSLDAEKMTSFVSDGTSVMTGRSDGVATKLKGLKKTLLSFHCIYLRVVGGGGGHFNFVCTGGVWPQDRKIDPSAD